MLLELGRLVLRGVTLSITLAPRYTVGLARLVWCLLSGGEDLNVRASVELSVTGGGLWLKERKPTLLIREWLRYSL